MYDSSQHVKVESHDPAINIDVAVFAVPLIDMQEMESVGMFGNATSPCWSTFVPVPPDLAPKAAILFYYKVPVPDVRIGVYIFRI